MRVILALLAAFIPFNSLLYSSAWIDYAAHILAGETAPNCEECHQAISCTLIYDAELRINRGVSPFSLYPNRWHGWKYGNDYYKRQIRKALVYGCDEIPMCRFLGNRTDYYEYFRHIDGTSPVVWDDTIFCVPVVFGSWPRHLTPYKFALDIF